MTSKADYVRSQGQTRNHTCHWPGCTKQVPPAMWGCRNHWFALPSSIRREIWATYRPGQEATIDPSEEYVRAAARARMWITTFRKPAESAMGGEEKDDHA